MKVKIWSDVMCPFCYIGKRRFEQALASFDFKDQIKIEWKSFQLNPLLKTNTEVNIYQSLADSKGWQLDYSKQVHSQVTEMAAQAGLTYNFDQAIVANSFKAHRFSHLAKQHGLGDAAEEQLFKAYFTDGKNIDDTDTLISLGVNLGLDAQEVKQALESEAFTDKVYADIEEAERLGIRAVPFFVMNDKYAVSGAQASEVFFSTLVTAYSEWQQQQPAGLQVIEGPACDIDGNCD
ncbi:DsbA family oxidoreductase [Mucilaginibacter sp. Bleaf8]|uniref:DsbA family oxidoreductase n=1 Tax=Mucilaginibacter sp. Bleaf8 TaxID=2834430 RepID=UPI001BD18C07|nr:DsbA family oxidoreductase [Mucilaginibacter sp. Bleaf8]MBS7564628.1 DsbA family oxidoreductase [Mucilaginibacter sp. Bleaf8]